MPSPRAEISDVAVSPDHFIGGKRVDSEKTFEVRSPLDWEWKLADVARGDALTADMAVTAAVDAFSGWAALGPAKRAEYSAPASENDEVGSFVPILLSGYA